MLHSDCIIATCQARLVVVVAVVREKLFQMVLLQVVRLVPVTVQRVLFNQKSSGPSRGSY